ncbi:UDP-N-acetylenolpyruvoylglucosamine reductase [Athalassotoga saccharophila]|nr:UDP-N-acetylenolpyruvoylglucosamine reductase [Athalassotoga saccharophila]
MITTIQMELSKISKIKIGPSATIYMAENAFEYAKNPVFVTDKIVLGNCSKVLIGDNVKDVIINVDQNPVIEHYGEILHVSSGLKVDYLMEYLLKHEIGGPQYLAGIPATIGGLIWMNGGAFGHHIWEDILYIRAIDLNGRIIFLNRENVKFSYRYSDLKSFGVKFIVDAFLRIHKMSYSEISKEISEKIEYRKVHHPVDYPSLGSTFKNSPDMLAWKVIQEIGLVNYRIGDAKFSEKHPNFIVNLGDATFTDVKTLVECAMERSLKKLNLKISPEIIFIE